MVVMRCFAVALVAAAAPLSPSLEDRYIAARDEAIQKFSKENDAGKFDDAAQKAAWYLRNERERMKIAAAYAARTRGEHMWEQRFAALFKEIGLSTTTRAKRVAA